MKFCTGRSGQASTDSDPMNAMLEDYQQKHTTSSPNPRSSTTSQHCSSSPSTCHSSSRHRDVSPRGVSTYKPDSSISSQTYDSSPGVINSSDSKGAVVNNTHTVSSKETLQSLKERIQQITGKRIGGGNNAVVAGSNNASSTTSKPKSTTRKITRMRSFQLKEDSQTSSENEEDKNSEKHIKPRKGRLSRGQSLDEAKTRLSPRRQQPQQKSPCCQFEGGGCNCQTGGSDIPDLVTDDDSSSSHNEAKADTSTCSNPPVCSCQQVVQNHDDPNNITSPFMSENLRSRFPYLGRTVGVKSTRASNNSPCKSKGCHACGAFKYSMSQLMTHTESQLNLADVESMGETDHDPCTYASEEDSLSGPPPRRDIGFEEDCPICITKEQNKTSFTVCGKLS